LIKLEFVKLQRTFRTTARCQRNWDREIENYKWSR